MEGIINGYSTLIGAKYFTNDTARNYLVFQPLS